jgi:hypothetical protein
LSEFVGTQEGGDHVGADEQGAEPIDELNEHASDPLQAEGVEDEDANDGEAREDVDHVGHGARPKVEFTPIGLGPMPIRRPFRSVADRVRDL